MKRRFLGAPWAGYPAEDIVPPRSSAARPHEPTLRAFLDTSVLLAAVDRGEPDRRELARGILGPHAYRHLVTSAQVLAEFFAGARRFDVPVEEETAVALVRELARDVDVVPITATDVLAAIALRTVDVADDLASGEELTLREALIVRAALAAGCDVLLTCSLPDGLRFVGLDGRGGPDVAVGDGGLVVEDPFAVDLGADGPSA